MDKHEIVSYNSTKKAKYRHEKIMCRMNEPQHDS